MLPPRAQAPATKVATQAAWGIAAGVLANAVPNHFWTRCEDMWIDQNLKYRNHLIEYNVAWGLKKRKSLKKIVSYWGAVKLPTWAMQWSDPNYPGFADLGNAVYADTFKALWPYSHICGYSDDTIGDFIEALLGWYIYWTTEWGAQFEKMVHLVVEHLNMALLSEWTLRSFYRCSAFR